MQMSPFARWKARQNLALAVRVLLEAEGITGGDLEASVTLGPSAAVQLWFHVPSEGRFSGAQQQPAADATWPWEARDGNCDS